MSRLLYDPQRRHLLTDQREWIKALECPWSVSQLELSPQDNWQCQHCHKRLTPVWEHPPEELLMMVRQDPDLCLILDPHHEALELIFDYDSSK